jgi:hypothetical protein
MGFLKNLVGGLPVIGGIITGNQQIKQSNAINPVDANYNESPYAKQRFALAQTLLNARMPGAAAMQQNIFTNQANAYGQIDRNATDGSQALALAGGIQGQTNQAIQQQGILEGQNFQNNLNNLEQAQQGMVSEGDKVYQDQIRKYNNSLNQKNQLMNAGQQNIHNGFNDALNIGLTAFSGGFKKPVTPKI